MYINDNSYSVKSIVTLNGGNKKGFYLFIYLMTGVTAANNERCYLSGHDISTKN